MQAVKSTQQKTLNFFTTVEAGDIALFHPFQEAIAVFGFTKVGKTCSCHILCNSIVKAHQVVGGDLAYTPSGDKYKTAIIGQDHNSQTEIPNIFETKFLSKNREVKVNVLDQPGYGDSYGFHRILSNGYFHYRTFSKTPKLKFILAFKKSDLQGTAQNFKKTILNFIKTFAHYDYIKHKILAATAFLVTKAQLKSKIEDLTAILKTLKVSIHNMTATNRAYYQQMIQHMIDCKKIFFIQKPASISTNSIQNNMLKQIYEKTQFWERPTFHNMVDMSEINFSVANQILRSLDDFGNDEVFKEEYAYFMNYMMGRMKKILVQDGSSLKNLIQILKKDAVNGVEEHSFLKAMSSFNSRYYKFTEHFQTDRIKLESNLFKSNEINDISDEIKKSIYSGKAIKNQRDSPEAMKNSRFSTSTSQERDERNRDMRTVYFVRKFKVLDYIIQKTNEMMEQDNDRTERTIEQLENMSAYFIDIFKKMDILRIESKDSPNIIYKYTYVIQRLIEQAKIITLILYNNSEHRTIFAQYGVKKNIELVDIYRLLKDKVFAYLDFHVVQNLKIDFCKKVDITKFELVNEQIIELFEQILSIDDKLIHKVISLVIRYYQIITQKNKGVTDQNRKYVASKLLEYRQKCYKFLINLQKNPKFSHQEKEGAIQQIFALSNSLSNLLVCFNNYSLAREVYKSVSNAEMVFKMYEAELKTMEDNRKRDNDLKLENNREEERNLLMEYGTYAWSACRKDLALKCYSQAYNRASSFQGLKEASKAIVRLQTRNDLAEEDVYLKAFYNQNFCLQLPREIQTNIQLICNIDQMNLSLSILR